MMKKLYLVLFFSFSIFNFAQISPSELVGDWKVVKILNKIDNKQLEDGFKTSVFKFDKNVNFTLKSSNDNPLFSQIETMTKNTKWKNDFVKNRVEIGTKKDNYTTMLIAVDNKNNKIVFHIIESNNDLEMTKL